MSSSPAPIFILITNNPELINSPSVQILVNGEFTGSITSLGFDKSEKRALEIAEQYKATSHPSAEIVNLYHFRPTPQQLGEYLAALNEYYWSWIDHPRFNEAAPALQHKCAMIKLTFIHVQE